MANRQIELRQKLVDCVEAAKMPGTELEYERHAAVETESESTNLTVRFAQDRSSDPSLNLRLLLDRLEKETVVGSLDLIAAPYAHLVLQGALGQRNYKITINV